MISKFQSIKMMFRECFECEWFDWIGSDLLEKPFMENFIFCAMREFSTQNDLGKPQLCKLKTDLIA